MMNDFFDKIFVINLQRSSERRDYIHKIMSDFHVEFEFIEAVDGQELFPTFESIQEFWLENSFQCEFEEYDSVLDYHPNWFPNQGQLGCWFSHKKIWQKVIDENISTCLILEDDISFNLPDESKSFSDNFNDYANALPSDWSVFMLGYGGGPTNIVNDHISQLWHPSWTHAYALKPIAAEALLHFSQPMRYALDYFTGAMFFANATDRQKDHFYTRWDTNACNNSHFDFSLLSNIQGYASSTPLFYQGGEFPSNIN